MPMNTLPKRLTELGRIRLGDRVPTSNGKTRPHKLDAFRLTSPNKPLLHYAAGLYGGEVAPWDGEGAPTDENGRPTQFELYTEVNSLDVLIPTLMAVSVQYEIWKGGLCTRRCNGTTIQWDADETSTEERQPCRCDANHAVCARVLRLNVLLPDLPGLGVWRLDTKGYYATAELLGTCEQLQYAGATHAMIEAVLRLEQRTIKRLTPEAGGRSKPQTFKFAVPVLWPKYTPRQLLQGASNMLLTPADQSKALVSHIADLTGDQDALQSRLQAAREGMLDVMTGEILEEPPVRSAEAASPVDEAPQPSKRGGQMIITAINQLHMAHDKPAHKISEWWERVCRDKSVGAHVISQPQELALSDLTELLTRAKRAYEVPSASEAMGEMTLWEKEDAAVAAEPKE